MLNFATKLISQYKYSLLFFNIFSAINILVYMAIGLFLAELISKNSDLDFLGFYENLEVAFAISLLAYFTSYILPIFIQLRIANSFMVDLTKEYDLNTKVSAIAAMPEYNYGSAMTDNTVEFPRFSANIIIPLLDITKNTINLVFLVIFLIVFSSEFLWILTSIPACYLAFWVISRPYFKKMSFELSTHFYTRQRVASYRFQAYTTDLQVYEQSSTRRQYFKSLSRLGDINVYTKVMATLPRAILESLVLLVLYFLFIGTEDITPLIMVGFGLLKLLPAVQSISNSVSQLQTNFPAYTSFEQRATLLRSYGDAARKASRSNCPTIFSMGETFSTSYGLNYSFKKPLDLNLPGLYIIKGQSGVGKSTFVRSLLGFEQLSGHDFIPGNRNAGIASQNENLLEGTVFDNFYEINKGFESLDVYQDLLGSLFPEFLDHNNSEVLSRLVGGNSGFSGGQLARIKLMKVLLLDKQFVFLDEAFDGVPSKLASKIMHNLLELLPDTSFVLIDHNNIDHSIAHTHINLKTSQCEKKLIEIVIERTHNEKI